MQTGLCAYQWFFWHSWEVSAAFSRLRTEKKTLTDLVTIITALALVTLKGLVANFRLDLPTIEAA
jgi:hypothetical protein